MVARLNHSLSSVLEEWFQNCKHSHASCQLRNKLAMNKEIPAAGIVAGWFVICSPLDYVGAIAFCKAEDTVLQMEKTGCDTIHLTESLDAFWLRINSPNSPSPWFVLENGASNHDFQKAATQMELYGWDTIYIIASLEAVWPILRSGHFP
ncbi:hypothetical protein C8J57DRAFT_1252520 [Mycena rebaudengoi]|nr:hypothetical protein C8J57DRAFT_1252520 [Mycena rebaudengoi]